MTSLKLCNFQFHSDRYAVKVESYIGAIDTSVVAVLDSLFDKDISPVSVSHNMDMMDSSGTMDVFYDANLFPDSDLDGAELFQDFSMSGSFDVFSDTEPGLDLFEDCKPQVPEHFE